MSYSAAGFIFNSQKCIIMRLIAFSEHKKHVAADFGDQSTLADYRGCRYSKLLQQKSAYSLLGCFKIVIINKVF